VTKVLTRNGAESADAGAAAAGAEDAIVMISPGQKPVKILTGNPIRRSNQLNVMISIAKMPLRLQKRIWMRDPMKPPKKWAVNAALRAGGIAGGATETGATGMAAVVAKPKAMAMWRMRMNLASHNRSVKLRRSSPSRKLSLNR
jgi:hypothetical protein